MIGFGVGMQSNRMVAVVVLYILVMTIVVMALSLNTHLMIGDCLSLPTPDGLERRQARGRRRRLPGAQ